MSNRACKQRERGGACGVPLMMNQLVLQAAQKLFIGALWLSDLRRRGTGLITRRENRRVTTKSDAAHPKAVRLRGNSAAVSAGKR